MNSWCNHHCTLPRVQRGRHVLVCRCGDIALVDPSPIKKKQERIRQMRARRA